MKRYSILICIFLIAGCNTTRNITEQVEHNEAVVVDNYAKASASEAIAVLTNYLSLVDQYDARGWKARGLKTDAIRAMTEARLAAIYRDMAQPNKCSYWLQQAVTHKHLETGSTNATADGLLHLVDTLDKHIDPKWRHELGQHDVSGYQRQNAPPPDL